ncbi:hypothetical protein CHS0354_015808 [Potamilus streckersoni]|uniref:CUB domain-containing protein n=1 Tax=Potamilus streckersoni TaxID=2493646 RepID=A0AAE0SDQ6_9BIVA|nr:hypothetical protein CHS0354_015808 [Potamilus streckersoni]
MTSYCGQAINMSYYGINDGRIELTSLSSYQRMTCTLTIVAPSINDRIMFFFEDVDIKNSTYCTDDSLQLFDGPNTNYQRISGLYYKICGYSKPGGVYTTTSNTLTLLFISYSGSFLDRGFDVIFTAYHLDRDILPRRALFSSVWLRTIGLNLLRRLSYIAYREEINDPKMSNFCYVTALVLLGCLSNVEVSSLQYYYMTNYCGQRINMNYNGIDSARLQLTSLNSYQPMTCTLTIVAPSVYKRIMFYFKDVDIKNSIYCSDDSLQLIDGPNANYPIISGLSYKICGYSKPSGVYTTTGNTLTFLFTSRSGSFLNRGFDVVFTAYHGLAIATNTNVPTAAALRVP